MSTFIIFLCACRRSLSIRTRFESATAHKRQLYDAGADEVRDPDKVEHNGYARFQSYLQYIRDKALASIR